MASAQNEFVKVWTVGDLVPKVTVREHVRIVHTVRFSSDGKLLLAGDYYESHLWDVATRQEVTTVERRGVRQGDNVDISPNGEMLAMSAQGTMGHEYRLELRDVSTKRKVRILALNNPFAKVRFSHTGRFLASWGEREKSVRVWDLNVQPDVVKNVKASEQTSFSPDGVLLAIGTRGGIELWDVKTQQAVATLKIKTDEVVKAFDFSPDGVLLAIGTRGGIELWDMKTRNKVATLKTDEPYIDAVEFSPDGRRLAVAGRNLRYGNARLDVWDVASKSKQKITTHLPRDSRNCFCFSPDGKRLAFLRSGGHPTETFDVLISDFAAQRGASLYMTRTSYRRIKFSPDGALLALTGADGTILWDVKTQRVVAVLPSSDGSSRSSVAFSADGELLAIANRDGPKRQVHVWNVEAAKRSVMLFPFEFP